MKLNYLTYFFMLLAGGFNGVMDILSYHYDKSIFSTFANQQFWNPVLSWKNKYKDRPDTIIGRFSEKYDNTFLVRFTDGWHSMKGGMITCIILAVFLHSNTNSMIMYLCDTVFWYVGFWITFESKLLRKK